MPSIGAVMCIEHDRRVSFVNSQKDPIRRSRMIEIMETNVFGKMKLRDKYPIEYTDLYYCKNSV